jgi:hypothetical protein
VRALVAAQKLERRWRHVACRWAPAARGVQSARLVRPAARGGRRGAVARELEHDGERSRNGSDGVLAADVELGRNVWGACADSAGVGRERTARTGPSARAGVCAEGPGAERHRRRWLGRSGGAQARMRSACGSRRCRWSREAAAVRAGERRHHGGRLRLMSEDALAACSAERRGGAAALGQCRRAIVARSERAQRGNRRVRARASSEHESGSDLV